MADWSAKTSSASVVFTVGSEEVKSKALKSGILIGGLLLRPVNYKQQTTRTQFLNCLKFGHHSFHCKSRALCAICSGSHTTSSHCCESCKSSVNCNHHPTKCVNCKHTSHHALQRQDCEFYKALTC